MTPPAPVLRISLRTKLALVSLVLLALPWAGWRYVKEMERFLLDAQQSALRSTARAIATALHERPALLGVRPDDSALRQQAEEELRRLAAAHAAQKRDAASVLDEAADVGPPLFAKPAGPAVDAQSVPRAEPPLAEAVPDDPQDEIRAILRGLERSTTTRIWVVDRRYRVLALAGSLKSAAAAPPKQPNWRNWLERPLQWLMPPPPQDFDDSISADILTTANEIGAAFLGAERTGVRQSRDGKVTIVSAAHPIWSGDQVLGAVVAEETTNAILVARNQALERLLLVTLVVIALAGLFLLGFASRLSSRIRKLRDEAEATIDAQGRIVGSKVGLRSSSAAGDEVGDLSRSFSAVLGRLSQHHGYLEGMASRLSHELRTPIAVVRSSLENIRLSGVPGESGIYLDRADEGLARLTTVLIRMTEATRLEQSLQSAEQENYDLCQVVAGCVAGYRQAFSGRRFELEIRAQPLMVRGAPDLAAQMLDKLVANAVDFAVGDTPVSILLSAEAGQARLDVINQGQLLPEEMRDRLFQSMVSVRKERSGPEPHLGLGLYVARLIAEFHGGVISAANTPSADGVAFTVRLPLVVTVMP